MTKPPDKGGGNSSRFSIPDQPTLDSVWTGQGVPGGSSNQQRPYSQIIAEENTNRNMIKIHLKRSQPTEPDTTKTVKNLTFEDLGEFLFDILNIKTALGLISLLADTTLERYNLSQRLMLPHTFLQQVLTTLRIMKLL